MAYFTGFYPRDRAPRMTMRPDRTPLHPDGAGAPRWTWRDHARGTPAEPLVRHWLAGELGVAPAAIALRRDAHGRPRLDGALRAFDVSWSHSGEGLLVALGRDMDVGIDLERLRPRPRALAVAERYFTTLELDWLQLQDADDRDEAFLRLWCAKEAVLKAHGRGLAFGLDKLAFAQGDGALVLVACDRALGAPADWQLREFIPQSGYRAALAWRRR